MKQGFVKVAAASCAVAVADVRENTRVILETIHKMEDEGAKVMVLPELALTGYTCSDLFWQSQMIDAAKEGLKEIADGTKGTDALIFVGLPWEQGGKLFNVAAVLCHGELLGVVPKKYLPNYNEFYELRHFTPGKEAVTTTEFFGKEVPFGMNLLFQCAEMPRLKVAAELCEDLWTPNPPSVAHALAGATVIVNLSASDEMVGKDSYRRSLVSAQSARLICGYIYATAGEGESTTDLVFGGQHLIAENGTILAEAKRFENQIVCADLDVDRLTSERRRMTTYPEQRTDGHAFLGLARGRSGYLHKASLQMNVSAVTAACMMMKKEVFEEVGGFEEELSVAFNDVDLCLRIGKAGYKIVYNPHVELYHYESKSRGAEDDEKKVRRFQSEIEFMRSRWIGLLKAGDPCYNPNLTLASWNYGLRADGRGVKPWTK